MRRAATLATLATLGACGQTTGTLGDLEDVTLDVRVDGSTVRVTLADPVPDIVDDFDRCFELEGARGLVNGTPLQMVSSGGWYERGGEYERCDSPGFTAKLSSPPADLDIVIRDDTREVRVQFAAIRVDRQLTRVRPEGAAVSVGSAVELAWSVIEDDLADMELHLVPASGGSPVAELPITVSGSQLAFTMPVVPPGGYEIWAGSPNSYFELPVQTCTAESCALSLSVDGLPNFHRPVLPVTVTAP